MKIEDMPTETRPREKALEYGIHTLSDRELLALFIRTGTRKKSSLEIADEVIKLSGGLSVFAKLSKEALMTIPGIKEAKAIELMATVEMGKRIIKPSKLEEIFVNEPKNLISWLNYEIGFELQEHFLVVYMNNQNRILSHEVLFKGTIDRSIVHPRDIFREAVSLSATRIILVHNHPGQTMQASSADIEVTEIIVKGGKLVGVEVLDHLIVSHGEYISLRSIHPALFD